MCFTARLQIIQAVLHAVAKVRKELKAKQPALPQGRPSKAHKAKRIGQRITDLFDHRHLFVQHHLTPAQWRTCQQITRGLPHLRTLRQIMDEVYRLFDRRCRTETALAKLARLRQRVRRFKHVGRTLTKLLSPNLEKALTFLDDRLLPATSNAVERPNRRFRKAQRGVYSVRTAEHLRQRHRLGHATSPAGSTSPHHPPHIGSSPRRQRITAIMMLQSPLFA